MLLRSAVVILLLAGGCSGPATAPPDGPFDGSGATSDSTTTTFGFAVLADIPAVPMDVTLRVEDRTSDPDLSDFEQWVRVTLLDERGWQRAGYRFSFSDEAAYTIVLADGEEVDELCLPYDTTAGSSCQNGPFVVLRAERWREATEKWTGDLTTYRQMLVNHEVGHLLGQHHPDPQCPDEGELAPVMAQQSSKLEGCLPNPWPLDWEIACAQLRLEPVAPPYEDEPTPLCTAGGPVVR